MANPRIRESAVVSVAQPKIMRCPPKALIVDSENNIRARWLARVPVEHTHEDVLSPFYFGEAIGDRGVREGDVIEVEPEHALWSLQVRVMAIIPSLHQVVVRLRGDIEEYHEEFPDGYSCEWKGTEGRWMLVKGDLPIQAGFISQTEALRHLEDLQRNRAA